MVVGLAYFADESYNLYSVTASEGKGIQRPATVDPNLPRFVVNAGKPILNIIITRSSCGSRKSGQGEVIDKRKNQMDGVERAPRRGLVLGGLEETVYKQIYTSSCGLSDAIPIDIA